MANFARTYGSIHHPDNLNNAWQFPTGSELDTFGVIVHNHHLTFGLEEFNFNPFLIKEKLAYVPCFGTLRTYPRDFIEELRLIYRVPGNINYCYVHYATLLNVSPLLNNDIQLLQNTLAPQLNQIYFRQESINYFGPHFPIFQEKINKMFDANVIADNHNDLSFLLNVKYEKLEILKNPVLCQINASYAGNWYQNVQYPCNCRHV
jgi:hypothetical protein